MKINKKNARIFAKATEQSIIQSHQFWVGVMCVIAKECGFRLMRERSYSNTSNKRLRKLFSVCRDIDDEVLDIVKKDNMMFFDIIYGGKLGNAKGTSDGWDCRGWGFNQLTGFSTWKRYGVNEARLKDPKHAAEVSIRFFEERIKNIEKHHPHKLRNIYGAKTINEIEEESTGGMLVQLACHMNAGFGYGSHSAVVLRAYEKAIQYYDEMLDIYWEAEG